MVRDPLRYSTETADNIKAGLAGASLSLGVPADGGIAGQVRSLR